MSVLTPQGPPRAPSEPGGPPGHPGAKRWWIAAGVLLVAVGLVCGLLVATGGNSPEGTTPPATPTTTPTTATPPPPTTTSPTTPPVVDVAVAVYPTPASTLRFAHPVVAARSFAVDFVGFVDPVVGHFVTDGDATGTVAVRATAGGAVTTVALQRIDGSWWVVGARTPDIRLDSPTASTPVASPVRLQGTSTAFEAQVDVEVREDGRRAPIGKGFVMGGSMGAMGPFDGSVAFTVPSAARGALVLSTVSMANGQLWEATVQRIAFASVAVLTPASSCPDYSMSRPVPAVGQMVVTVFYSCSVDGAPVPTYRLAPATSAVLRRALEQLLAGPTPAETAAGLTSWFSAATAGSLATVTVSSGDAVVDFHDLRSVIPGASSSAGARMLLSQLDATVFRFPTVHSVRYELDGSCQIFFEWLQLAGCQVRTPATS